MLLQRPSPGEVRDKQGTVNHQTHGIIHSLPLAERLVSTLMGYNPQTCAYSTLHGPQGAVCYKS